MPQTSPENDVIDGIDHSQYSSFLLRCQQTSGGEIRVRLTDIQTGQVITAVSLDEVPDLIRSLNLQADIHSTYEKKNPRRTK